MTSELIPTELSDEQKGQVFGILSVGCDRQTAADYVGCSLADIRRAMQLDSAFTAGVCRAEAGVELSHMRVVQETAREKKEWRAAVWWLERRSPERFGRRSADTVTARQLKEFIGVLADVLQEGTPSEEGRQQITARLKSLAESVEQMLRDGQLNGANPTIAADPSSPDTLVGDESNSLGEDLNHFDVEG